MVGANSFRPQRLGLFKKPATEDVVVDSALERYVIADEGSEEIWREGRFALAAVAHLVSGDLHRFRRSIASGEPGVHQWGITHAETLVVGSESLESNIQRLQLLAHNGIRQSFFISEAQYFFLLRLHHCS